MMRVLLACARCVSAAALLVAPAASAQSGSPSATSAPAAPDIAKAAPSPGTAPDIAKAAPSPGAAPEAPSAGCVEKLPSGKARPTLEQKFPARGLSGHALPLELRLTHGEAETVLPTGFRFQPDAPEAKSLKDAGFILPDPAGGAGPVVKRSGQGASTSSEVKISFVALPEKPGRSKLTLPALPITIARASGELMTLCTNPHSITIEDPIANEPNPKPKPNPPPRPQEEEWTALKNAVAIAAIALAVGALLAFVIGRWLRRPKPLPPPPPPRPPWEVAMEALHDLRHAGLTNQLRFAEHFDRVSDVVRRYLGDRYGFDGLESTTREMLSELRRFTPRIAVLDEIERFLRQADLVKFARLTPSEVECMAALDQASDIVQRTIPSPAELTQAPAESTEGPPPDQQRPERSDGTAQEPPP
jgi:hypothetical protein